LRKKRPESGEGSPGAFYSTGTVIIITFRHTANIAGRLCLYVMVEMAVIETASESPFRGLSTSVAFLLNLLFLSAEKQAQRKSSPLFRDGVQGYRPFTFTAR